METTIKASALRKAGLLAGLFAAIALGARSSSADAPPGRYSVANGTVTDTRTGLVWQATAPSGVYAWTDAVSYCQNLPLAGGGWRVPTCNELLTLVDPTRSNPAIDVNVFVAAPASIFWSSSPYLGTASNYAWYVDFNRGGTMEDNRSVTYRVRCVR